MNTGDGTRTHDLRIMRPSGAGSDIHTISAINSTSENITEHHKPLDCKPSRSVQNAEFRPFIAPVAISDHHDDISGIAPALLPKMLPADPDLAAVAEAWPGLPEEVRAGILAMVKATR